MPIVKFSPFAEFEETGFRLLQDAVARFANEPSARPWTPSVDVLETKNDLVLRADIPGLDMKDIEILLENGTLALKGERKFEEVKEEKSGYHRIERSFGSFARYFTLPDTVDAEHVKADYSNGVLTVTLPKKEVAKPRSIKVELSHN